MSTKRIDTYTSQAVVSGDEALGLSSGNTVLLELLSNDEIIDLVYPVGSQYTMYAVAASDDLSVAFPTAKQPATLFGGTWTQLWETDGVFFRTEGRPADGNITNGKQDDQMQGHRHYSGLGVADLGGSTYFGMEAVTGKSVFDDYDADGGTSTRTRAAIGSDPIADPTNGTPRTGGTTYPVNRLFRIYERTS